MKAYVVQDKHRVECPWCQTPYQATADLPIISLYRPGAGQGDYVFDNWTVAGLPRRVLTMYHVDPQKIPEPGDASFLGAHFELDSAGAWFLVNDSLEDARVADGPKAVPFKTGDRVRLKSDLKVLAGPSRGFRAGFVQMLQPVAPKLSAAKPSGVTKMPATTAAMASSAPQYDFEKTRRYYSEPELWNKIKKFTQQAGRELIEKALLLYYAAQSPATPDWAKTIIYGALGYFIFPVDAIPDIIPVAGYTDDLGALAMAITAVVMCITPEIRAQATKKMREWFGPSASE
jgi:uncharacterized membrane protein YkvA (DUF1232 family)